MRRLSLFAAACLALTATDHPDAGPVWLSGPSWPMLRAPAKVPSGLPLPRFVSLKAKRVNLRIGPGRDYAVAWLYTRSGVPMEVIQEYDNWRRVRDAEGTEGWVYQSLLSGDRTAMTAPWKKGEAARMSSSTCIAKPAATPMSLHGSSQAWSSSVKACDGDWCEAEADGTSGWMVQSEIWGAYPGEAFK
jgi:SH3-like domain-containing protein